MFEGFVYEGEVRFKEILELLRAIRQIEMKRLEMLW